MSHRIRIERTGPEGQVAHVVLQHADKHNALDWDMLCALVDTGRELARDRSLRAVIMRAEGPSFCSGLDFPRFTKQPAKLLRAFAKYGLRSTNLFQEACWVWRRLPVPVLAVVHGRCFGGGIQLALSADFRFVTPDCQMSILEAKWGLIPDMSGSVTLRELMPIDQAKRLVMTGRTFTGEEALGFGLATEVSEDPMQAAEALVEELLTRSPDAIAGAKRLLHETWVADEDAAFSRETRLQALVLAGQNQRAAMKANFARKAPKYSKRSRVL